LPASGATDVDLCAVFEIWLELDMDEVSLAAISGAGARAHRSDPKRLTHHRGWDVSCLSSTNPIRREVI
jgi:hypothetical protein